MINRVSFLLAQQYVPQQIYIPSLQLHMTNLEKNMTVCAYLLSREAVWGGIEHLVYLTMASNKTNESVHIQWKTQ